MCLPVNASNVLTVLQGLLSDGLLSWRLYVIYGRARWAFWIPTTAVIINASMFDQGIPYFAADIRIVVGSIGAFVDLAVYRNVGAYLDHYERLSFQVDAAWGWTMFGVNTMMTASIIGRIMCVRCTSIHRVPRSPSGPSSYVAREASAAQLTKTRTRSYNKVIEAIIESALVTWFGLVFYGVASVAPQSHITVRFRFLCVLSDA